MQSGVKIGLAIGLFVAVVATAYFVLTNRGGQPSPNKALANKADQKPQNQIERTPPPPPPVPEKAPELAAIPKAPEKVSEPGDVIRIEVDKPKPKAEDTPKFDSMSKPATEPAKAEPNLPSLDEILRNATDKVARTTPGKTDPEPGKVGPLPKLGEEKPKPVAEKPRVEDLILEVKPKPSIEPAKTAPLPGPAKEEEYTVQPGDSGWLIAQRKYGDARHMDILAKANPSVDLGRLKIGQKLIIPPLNKDATAVTAKGPEHGSTLTDSTGQTIYVVKPGDSFWTIAEKQYGNGKYGDLIKQANPKADPLSLKAGQQLVLPPKPAATATTHPTVGPRTEPEPALRAGEEVYVVQSGDNGFWGIAAKKYGDGTLMGAIAKANPNVDATRLRVGQKLVLPPEDEARKLVGGAATRPATVRTPSTHEPASARTGAGRAPAHDDGKPIFD